MKTLKSKSFARIFVDTAYNIPAVHDIIRGIDKFEYDYLPEDLIAPYSEYPTTVYTGKFDDMDMNILTARCWNVGIRIWVYEQCDEHIPPEHI